MSSKPPLHLFEAIGLELEYMIVDADTLDVRPIADRVLAAEAGRITGDVELGEVTWSNELALHVLELKCTQPAREIGPFVDLFQEHVRRVNAHLSPMNARLMPTAMHPWMDPDREMKLWPHEFNAVYEAFDRIFSTRGHGWANLQSFHINLPFADDEEFARLHTAIRLLLPIIPALTASSPVMDGRLTGLLDNRMEVYRKNSAKIPSISGIVIPEPVTSRAEYEEVIFRPMFDAIAPYDRDNILQHEWLNARGAIARFRRNAIEIRVLDVQECPAADLAIGAAIVRVLAWLVSESVTKGSEQRSVPTEALHRLFLRAIQVADEAIIDDEEYLRQFGFAGRSCSALDLWRHILTRDLPTFGVRWLATALESGLFQDEREITEERKGPKRWQATALQTVLDKGPLARRIIRAINGESAHARLRSVYSRLCDCLATGTMFHANPS